MRVLPQSLVSNGIPLSSDPHRLGWLKATDPALPMETLRKCYREQGYLWLKGFFERENILAIRRRFFESVAPTALLVSDSDPVDGIYSGEAIPHNVLGQMWTEAARLPEYVALCTGTRIWTFYESFLGGEIYLHPRKIVRATLPHDQKCTGGHYDLIYLRAGTDHICTSWIPLGDTPVEMGGLTYLEGSDALGRKMEEAFTRNSTDLSPEERINAYNKHMASGGWISKDLPTLADLCDGRWLVADYEAGDMVIHSPYMIHASTANTDAQRRMRFSTDIRYQRRSDAIDPRWAQDYAPGDGL